MRNLIITGGTGGLGSAVVPRLSREYKCILLGRDDLSNESKIRTAIDNAGSFYGLIHLVGGFTPGSVADTTLETWTQMMESNATIAFLLIRESLRKIQRPGRIVAISSEASLQKPPGVAAYTVSKSALNTLIEVTAAELAGTGITANALLPGTLDTAAMRKATPNARRVPLERVADTIAFLLSDAASSISGALIPLQA